MASGWFRASCISRMVLPPTVMPRMTVSVSPRVRVFPSMALLEWVYSMMACSSRRLARSGWRGLCPSTLFFLASILPCILWLIVGMPHTSIRIRWCLI